MARCNRIGSDCWLSEVAWVIKISNCCEWHWYRPRYRNIIVLPLCLSPHWHYTMHYWCLLLHATMALGTTPGSFTIDRLNCEWSNFAWIIHMATHCDFIWFSAQTGNILFASISFSGWYEIVVKYIHTRDSTIAIGISDGQFLRLPTNFFGIGQDIYNFVTFHSGSNFIKKLLTFFSFAYETELNHNVDLYRLHTLKYLINEYLV